MLNTNVLVVVLIVVVAAIIYWLFQEKDSNKKTYSDSSDKKSLEPVKWKNDNAITMLNKASDHFGEATHFDGSPGGFAVWDTNRMSDLGLCYDSVSVTDSGSVGADGNCHNLVLSILYYIPQPMRADAIRVSESLSYDAMSMELKAKCNSIGSAIAKLIVAIRVAEGYDTYEQVVTGGILGTLENKGKSLVGEHALYKDLCEYVKGNDAKKKGGNRDCETFSSNEAYDPAYVALYMMNDGKNYPEKGRDWEYLRKDTDYNQRYHTYVDPDTVTYVNTGTSEGFVENIEFAKGTPDLNTYYWPRGGYRWERHPHVHYEVSRLREQGTDYDRDWAMPSDVGGYWENVELK